MEENLKGIFASKNGSSRIWLYRKDSKSDYETDDFFCSVNIYLNLSNDFFKNYIDKIKYVKTEKSQIFFFENEETNSLICPIYNEKIGKIASQNSLNIMAMHEYLDNYDANKKSINKEFIKIIKKPSFSDYSNNSPNYKKILSKKTIKSAYVSGNGFFYKGPKDKEYCLDNELKLFEKENELGWIEEDECSFISAFYSFFKSELKEKFEWAEFENSILLADSIEGFNISIFYSKNNSLELNLIHFNHLKKIINNALKNDFKESKLDAIIKYYSGNFRDL